MEEVEERAGKTEVFGVEQMPSVYSPENERFLQDPRLKRPRHKNVVDQAISFWRNVLLFETTLTRVCYVAPSDIISTHPGWINQMFSVPLLLQDE